MIALRPYQHKAINDIREAFRTHKRVVFVMPTGSGKTCCFSYICAAAVEKGKRVLVLSDRTEIFLQSIKAISAHNIPICKIDPDNRLINSESLLYHAMVETFKRRIERLKHITFDLIIVDECHKNSFNKVFDSFPDTKVLGCTATPVSKTMYKYYTYLIQSIDIPELIEQGYLSTCRGYEMTDDFSDLDIDKTGEFSDKSLYSHYNNSKLYDGIVDAFLEKCQCKKTLVFNCNIKHAKNTTAAFVAAGIKSFCITSETTNEERAWILSEWDRGAFLVLNNANILVAGYDNPSIEVIMVNRATTSIAVWLQAAGRGSRIFPGKKEFLLIDFGGNFSRHGLWQQPRTWSLDPPKKRKNTLGMAAVKNCKSCGAVVYASVRVCEYCGYKWEPTQAELAAGRLVEVQNEIRSGIAGNYVSQLSIAQLIELEKVKELKASYVWRIMRSRGAQAIGDYAAIKGYRDQWIIRQLETLEAEIGADGTGRVVFMDKKINEVPLIQKEAI